MLLIQEMNAMGNMLIFKQPLIYPNPNLTLKVRFGVGTPVSVGGLNSKLSAMYKQLSTPQY